MLTPKLSIDPTREILSASNDEHDRLHEPFSPSPLLFMQEWIAIRRKGQDFSQTMMGEICRGSKLDRPEARVVEDTIEREEPSDQDCDEEIE